MSGSNSDTPYKNGGLTYKEAGVDIELVPHASPRRRDLLRRVDQVVLAHDGLDAAGDRGPIETTLASIAAGVAAVAPRGGR